jgi:sugar O-acyltransferase (sialic acid O-acetyltransferase NeuD family)
MSEFYIIGSGGFSKEVYIWSNEILREEFDFKGFIDRSPQNQHLNIGNKRLPIIDECLFLEKVKPSKDINLVIGIGNPQIISNISQTYQEYNFPNIIHPSFIGNRNGISLGRGNIVTPGCIFTTDIIIGSFNIFNLHTTIGHDCRIGDNNVFNPGSNISGGVEIGSGNLFGTNCSVLQYLTIGNENIIGALSLVNKHISSNNTLVGVPAKAIKK